MKPVVHACAGPWHFQAAQCSAERLPSRRPWSSALTVSASDVDNADPAAQGVRDALQVRAIVGHHGVSPLQGTDDDGGIGDVGCVAAGQGNSDMPGRGIQQRFGATAAQEASEIRLGAATPRLREYDRRDDRQDPALERAGVERPQAPLVSLAREQRSTVVG